MKRIIIGTFIIIIGLSVLVGFPVLNLIIACALIVIGINVISGKKHQWSDQEPKTKSHDDYLKEIAIFSPVRKTADSKNFKGGEVTMIFSGGELDLSNVETDEKKIDLALVVVFGGGKIIIPKNWKVNVQGTAILGKYDNKTDKKDEDAPILNLKGTVIFGEVEIISK